MLISSNNSSNLITTSRFDESEVLLMTVDGDGRWLMMVQEGEAKWKCGEGSLETKYKLSETTTEKGKDGLDPPHPEPPFRFDWENYH
jgi:hypothetical protein